MKLSDAVRLTGWRVVRCKRPAAHPERSGKGAPGMRVMALTGGRLAMAGDSWDDAYHAAHEIAELLHGHKHCQLLFMTQANLLAYWHRLRTGRRDDPLCTVFNPPKDKP